MVTLFWQKSMDSKARLMEHANTSTGCQSIQLQIWFNLEDKGGGMRLHGTGKTETYCRWLHWRWEMGQGPWTATTPVWVELVSLLSNPFIKFLFGQEFLFCLGTDSIPLMVCQKNQISADPYYIATLYRPSLFVSSKLVWIGQEDPWAPCSLAYSNLEEKTQRKLHPTISQVFSNTKRSVTIQQLVPCNLDLKFCWIWDNKPTAAIQNGALIAFYVIVSYSGHIWIMAAINLFFCSNQ